MNDEPKHERRSSEELEREPPAPTPAIEPDVAESAPGDAIPNARGTTWLRVGRVVAAPLLAAAAVGVHAWLNVPSGEVRMSLRDQGKIQPKPKRPSKAATRVDDKAFEPRSEAALSRLVRRYEQVDFDDEPVVASWARRHQALVNKAVVVARKHAFEGAPEAPRVVVTGTRCRTVRCRFMLRSPYAHELELLDGTLQALRAGDGPLWRDYSTERIDPPRGAPADDSYLQVTVVFTADELDGRTFEITADADRATD